MKNKRHNNILAYNEKENLNVNIFEFECRGCQMRGRDNLWEGFVSSINNNGYMQYDNSYLVFEEEPNNEYDPNAIKVVVRGEFFGTVGYVGKEYTKNVKEILNKAKFYRIDMKFESDYFKPSIPLVISWTEEDCDLQAIKEYEKKKADGTLELFDFEDVVKEL